MRPVSGKRKRKKLNGDDNGSFSYRDACVQKNFEGYGVFSGRVISFDPIERLWLVVYEDGDKEELDEEGVRQGMRGVPQIKTKPQNGTAGKPASRPVNGTSKAASRPVVSKPSGNKRCVAAECPHHAQLLAEQDLLVREQIRCREVASSMQRQGNAGKKCTCHLSCFGDQAVLVQRREFAEPIKRSIQVRISSSCNDDDEKSKAVSKELKRLSTFNSLSGPLWSGSVAPEVVSPLIFESIPGLYLFQGLLLSSVTNGVRLLEEIKHDSMDLPDLVNGKYRKYVCSNSENDTNQLRVYFAPDEVRTDARTCPEIRRGAPPAISNPEWSKKLEDLFERAIFPYLQKELQEMEETERAAVIAACRTKIKSIPNDVMHPPDSRKDPELFHHTMVHYRGNLGSHFDPAWLGHIIIASSLEPADIVMVNPARNISQRMRLFAGDVYVLMGEARDVWAHEVQLWGQQEQRSSIVTRYWRPGHDFQERKWDNMTQTFWRDLRGAGHGDLK